MKFRLFRPLLIAFAAALLAAGVSRIGVLSGLDRLLYDIGFTARPARAPQNIVILGIDEAFMEGRHAYLAPRDRLASLIDNCVAGDARAVALDVWFHSRIDFDTRRGDWKLQRALQRAQRAKMPVVLADIDPEADV